MSAVFPINDDPRFRISTAAGGETSFSVPFPFQDDADIGVIKIDVDGNQTILTNPGDFTLTGAGEIAGGTANLAVPAVAGEKYIRMGAAILNRVTSIVRSGRFKSGAIDSDLDRFLIICQELARDTSRALKAPLGTVGATVTIGPEDSVLKVDSHGNLVEGPTAAEVAIAAQNAQELMDKLRLVGDTFPLPAGFQHLDYGKNTISQNTTWTDQAIVPRGGTIHVNNGVTLTVNGAIHTDLDQQIFTGDGEVTGSFGGGTVKTVWWGAQSGVLTSENDALLRKAVLAAGKAGVILEGGNRVYTLKQTFSGTRALPGNKNYNWQNFTIECLDNSQNVGVSINGGDPTKLANITASVARGDISVAVSSTAGMSVGQRIILINRRQIHATYDSVTGLPENYAATSEFAVIKAIGVGVVYLATSCLFSHELADLPILLDATRTTTFSAQNVTIKRDVSVVDHVGLELRFVHVLPTTMRFENALTTGLSLDRCSNEGEINVTGSDLMFGYGVAILGCDNINCGIVDLGRCRHVVSYGRASYAVTIDGFSFLLCGHGGGGDLAQNEVGTNAVLDSHPAHFGFHWDRVKGSVNADMIVVPTYPGYSEPSQITDGVTIETNGGHYSIGSIDVNGAHAPLSIQYYGGAKDLDEAIVRVGLVSGANLKTSSFAVNAENRNTRLGTLRLDVGSTGGFSGGIVRATSNIDNNKGGDIIVNVDNMSGECLTQSGIYAEATGHVGSDKGRVTVNVRDMDALCRSTNVNHGIVVAEGNVYTALHPTVPGVEINIGTGRLRRENANNSLGIRAIDAHITLGAKVDVSADSASIPLFGTLGIGKIDRTTSNAYSGAILHKGVSTVLANSTNYMDMANFTIPRGVLGVDGLVRFRFGGVISNNTLAVQEIRFRYWLQGAVLWQEFTAQLAVGDHAFVGDYTIVADGAANKQHTLGFYSIGDTSSVAAGVGDITAAAVSSGAHSTKSTIASDSNDITVRVTAEMLVADANLSIERGPYLAEAIR